MRRTLIVFTASAVLLLTFGSGAAGADSQQSVASAATSEWKVGNCYTSAAIADSTIDLASKVSCAKPHQAQIIAGAAIPKSLVKAGYRELHDTASSAHADLNAFSVDRVCASKTTTKSIFPTKSAALVKLLKAHSVIHLVPGGIGLETGWVLPGKGAFDAGAKDVLCLAAFTADSRGTTGDLRDLETGDALDSHQSCYLEDLEGSVTLSTCDEPHSGETIISLVMDVTDHPVDTSAWTDADWAPYDAACTAFASVLIGGEHPELYITSGIDPGVPLHKAPSTASEPNALLFGCAAYALEPGDLLPRGTLLGHGKRPVEVVPGTG